MTNPTLSIITVCFNAASTLPACMQSVADGKMPQVEYLVIDGGSTDVTADIVREFRDVVDGFVSESDAGIFDAMNKGLSMATGAYVAFLNADDVYLPGAIQGILAALGSDRDEVDVLYGDWSAVDVGGAIHERRADHRMTWRYSLCHQAIVARRAIFPVPSPFDLRYRLCADFDLILRWQAEGRRFKRLALPLVRFSEGGASAKFVQRSACESIAVALRRARNPWSAVFVVRIMLYLVRLRLASCAKRLTCKSLQKG